MHGLTNLKPETCRDVHKPQVINLRNFFILLVDLFELEADNIFEGM